MPLHRHARKFGFIPVSYFCPSSTTQYANPVSRVVDEYFHNVLAQPHDQLGRKGSVCPFIPMALRASTLLYKIIDGVPDEKTMNSHGYLMLDVYQRLIDRVPDQQKSFLSLLTVFPDIEPEDAPRLIDNTQHDLKDDFVERGLMVGQFHQTQSTPGLHSENFRPLQSPLPMLAMRVMTRADLPFLQGNPQHLAAYNRFFPQPENPPGAAPITLKPE